MVEGPGNHSQGSTPVTANQTTRALALATLGVVFGDIGTSPLYAIRECFHGEYATPVTHDNVLGILSLMFWALTLIVSVKYLTFIFRADNRGEGGVLALTALVRGVTGTPSRRRTLLIAAGVFGACLLYGDGMITPAISVLSAAEGLRNITPRFEPFVIPLTLIILAALFILQQRGTARVGALFGPVILVWFLVLTLLGLKQIVAHPSIFAAVNPVYGFRYLAATGLHGFTVLGAVFLVVTGAEALYADLGHFGRRPIRLVWFYLVFPALLINYFGQGALLLARPEEASHPFYAMVPTWGVIPMVILATSATIIASQAVITAVFSLTRQAVQMGYLPRLKIVHTSVGHLGQIYVPQVNWIMMIATLGLVLGFQSSSKLAAAYGVAVTSTMLMSSLLFYVVTRDTWRWSMLRAVTLVAVFLVVDISFFSANIGKLLHGAWFPLALGAVGMTIMMTWERGRKILASQLDSLSVHVDDLTRRIASEKTVRVRGNAIFLTGCTDSVPVALSQNIEHNKVVHAQVGLLNFSHVEIPRVPTKDKVRMHDLGSGFYQISAFYGFMESPSVPQVLALAKEKGSTFRLEETSFFLGRERLVVAGDGGMSSWRSHLFAFLSRNAYDASRYYDLPQQRVMEVGVQLHL